MSDHHHRGLATDLDTLLHQASSRRRLLRWMGGLALPLAGCGGGGSSAAADTTSTSGGGGTTTTSGSCAVINEETAGPYPGDGSNSVGGSVANALALSGIVRSDIRAGLAGATGVATGVPLKLTLVLVNANGSCAALAGYGIYLWHCDAAGRYSMYSSGVTAENYLRGVQATDATGTASFTTIFPGCYSGRMPHMHFEVYRSVASATSFSSKLKTSQIAFPVATCQAAYAASGYASSVANLAAISFASDNVFSDGVTLELATVTGNNTDGYEATLRVGIAV
jgi:protocatechuate 3,4-dioxygenase beta subunit